MHHTINYLKTQAEAKLKQGLPIGDEIQALREVYLFSFSVEADSVIEYLSNKERVK